MLSTLRLPSSMMEAEYSQCLAIMVLQYLKYLRIMKNYR